MAGIQSIINGQQDFYPELRLKSDRIRDIIQDKVLERIEDIVQAQISKSIEEKDTNAAKLLFDYASSKPEQKIKHTGGIGIVHLLQTLEANDYANDNE